MPPSTPAPCRSCSPRRSARSRTCWWSTIRRSSCCRARSSRRNPKASRCCRSTCSPTSLPPPSSAPTGTASAREIAEDIVKECGAGSGKSGKVAIIPGQLTAADSVIMNDAAFKVFEAAQGDPGRLQPGFGLGAGEGAPDHRDRAAAASGPVRHLRPLGRAHDGRRQCGQGRRQGRRRAGLFDRRRRRRGLQGGRGQASWTASGATTPTGRAATPAP